VRKKTLLSKKKFSWTSARSAKDNYAKNTIFFRIKELQLLHGLDFIRLNNQIAFKYYQCLSVNKFSHARLLMHGQQRIRWHPLFCKVLTTFRFSGFQDVRLRTDLIGPVFLERRLHFCWSRIQLSFAAFIFCSLCDSKR
jgi:hypothetical protein